MFWYLASFTVFPVPTVAKKAGAGNKTQEWKRAGWFSAYFRRLVYALTPAPAGQGTRCKGPWSVHCCIAIAWVECRSSLLFSDQLYSNGERAKGSPCSKREGDCCGRPQASSCGAGKVTGRSPRFPSWPDHRAGIYGTKFIWLHYSRDPHRDHSLVPRRPSLVHMRM